MQRLMVALVKRSSQFHKNPCSIWEKQLHWQKRCTRWGCLHLSCLSWSGIELVWEKTSTDSTGWYWPVAQPSACDATGGLVMKLDQKDYGTHGTWLLRCYKRHPKQHLLLRMNGGDVHLLNYDLSRTGHACTHDHTCTRKKEAALFWRSTFMIPCK